MAEQGKVLSVVEKISPVATAPGFPFCQPAQNPFAARPRHDEHFSLR